MTREAWLQAGVDRLRPRFDAAGAVLPPKVHVSVGFPSKAALARKQRRIGECWRQEVSADGNCHVFISPVLVTPVEMLDVLTHELVHVVTPGAKHGGQFITVSKAIGLTGSKKWTSACAGDALKAELEAVAREIGDLPHSPLNAHALEREKKQSTRMVKCECEGCGYTVRTTRKWLEIGTPICPACEVSMMPDTPTV